VSSFVNTDWYCRFRISALSLASACNIPASLSGAIPFVSFPSDLMYDQNLFCFGDLSSWSGSPISMMLMMYFLTHNPLALNIISYFCVCTEVFSMRYGSLSYFFLWRIQNNKIPQTSGRNLNEVSTEAKMNY
jgi:hypothetical protein